MNLPRFTSKLIMEPCVMVKGRHYALSPREKSESFPKLKSTPSYYLNTTESSSHLPKPIFCSKQSKINTKTLSFPTELTSNSILGKVKKSIVDNKLLKSRFLNHRNSETITHSGHMFGSLPGEKKTFVLNEFKFNCETTSAVLNKEKKLVLPLSTRIRMLTKEQKHFHNKQLAYIDHTVPQSITIQSKS